MNICFLLSQIFEITNSWITFLVNLFLGVLWLHEKFSDRTCRVSRGWCNIYGWNWTRPLWRVTVPFLSHKTRVAISRCWRVSGIFPFNNLNSWDTRASPANLPFWLPHDDHSFAPVQCYDKYLSKSLRKAAESRGHLFWARGPDNTGSYNSQPQGTGFFCDGGDYDGLYGRFFLKWYSQVLIDHADQILCLAKLVFDSSCIAAKVIDLVF